MSGLEATEIICKENPENLRPKAIIALTADVCEETRIKCLSVGMSDVLTKPIEHQKLKEKLFSICNYQS